LRVIVAALYSRIDARAAEDRTQDGVNFLAFFPALPTTRLIGSVLFKTVLLDRVPMLARLTI